MVESVEKPIYEIESTCFHNDGICIEAQSLLLIQLHEYVLRSSTVEYKKKIMNQSVNVIQRFSFLFDMLGYQV